MTSTPEVKNKVKGRHGRCVHCGSDHVTITGRKTEYRYYLCRSCGANMTDDRVGSVIVRRLTASWSARLQVGEAE